MVAMDGFIQIITRRKVRLTKNQGLYIFFVYDDIPRKDEKIQWKKRKNVKHMTRLERKSEKTTKTKIMHDLLSRNSGYREKIENGQIKPN